MEQFIRDGDFVHSHTLRYVAVSGYIAIVGQIGCLGNIVITVEKYLELIEGGTGEVALNGDGQEALVQTALYSYNGHIRGHATFLRDDNTHRWPGHSDDHHRHHEDWRGIERPRVEWVGEHGWLRLDQFIEMVCTWYHSHRDELPAPDDIPTLEEIVPRLSLDRVLEDD